MDITNYTAIKDSHEFSLQENIYTFTAPRDGNYRFWVSDTVSGSEMYMKALDSYENHIFGNSYSTHNPEHSEYLTAGETYTIILTQAEEFCSYVLNVEQTEE